MAKKIQGEMTVELRLLFESMIQNRCEETKWAVRVL